MCSPEWLVNNFEPGRKIVIVEHTAADIAAIPYASDGKYRIRRGVVVGEVTMDALVAGLRPGTAPATQHEEGR